MKSMFSNKSLYLGAILAMSLTMTGCYEKDDAVVDITVTPEPTPAPDAIYVISGTVMDSENGNPIANQAITLVDAAGTAYNVAATDKSGFFICNTLKNPGTYTLTINKEGYLKVVRTIYLAEVQPGQTCQMVTDIYLHNAVSATDVEKSTQATVTAGKGEDVEKASADISKELADVAPEFKNISVSENFITISEEKTIDPVSSVDVRYNELTGYAIVSGDLITRDATDADFKTLALERMELLMGAKAGLKAIPSVASLACSSDAEIVGYVVSKKVVVKEIVIDVTIDSVKKSFKFIVNDYNVYGTTVTSKTQLKPSDTHDTHDGHDGHGSNPSAGGGSSL